MIRSILYATDLGLFAPYVLRHALALARSHAADLHVLHVVEPLGLFAESLLQSYLDADTLQELRLRGLDTVMSSIERQVFERFCDELRDSGDDPVPIRAVRVRLGDPPRLILEEARVLGVDLLVVGAHSQSATLGAMLGRTCQRVLQQAAIPVYLVPLRPELME